VRRLSYSTAIRGACNAIKATLESNGIVAPGKHETG
jgi:hypothetical protein